MAKCAADRRRKADKEKAREPRGVGARPSAQLGQARVAARGAQGKHVSERTRPRVPSGGWLISCGWLVELAGVREPAAAGPGFRHESD
jgi:hypothetical protein